MASRWASGNQAGISVYQIEKGPKLVGEWAPLGGFGEVSEEVLTAKRKAIETSRGLATFLIVLGAGGRIAADDWPLAFRGTRAA